MLKSCLFLQRTFDERCRARKESNAHATSAPRASSGDAHRLQTRQSLRERFLSPTQIVEVSRGPILWTAAPHAFARCCIASVLLVSCGGGGDPDSAPDFSQAPRYVVSVQVFNSDLTERSTIVAFTDSIDSGELSLENGLEVAGGGNVWGIDGSGEFFVTSAERPTISKYRFVGSTLQEAGELGLASRGVARLFGEVMVFESRSVAYLFDLNSAQALELNLADMEIGRSIDLSPLLDEGTRGQTFLWWQFFARGAERVSVTFATDAAEDTVSPISRLVRFNPSSGELGVTPAPCGGLQYGATTENGDIFFASGPITAAIHAIEPTRAPAPCLVRLGSQSEPSKWEVVRLNDLTGRPTGGLIPAGDSGAYLRVLDNQSFPVLPDTQSRALFGAPAWETWSVELPVQSGAQRLERELVGGGIRWFEVDGQVYENQSNGYFSSTLLTRTTGPQAPAPALRTPGIPFSIIRLR